VTGIRDNQARILAATTFDRNVVVTASAGTGKTTLLITRLVHLLVKSPDPMPLSQVVALTFMNKAANEIKLRLRECLEALAAPQETPAARDLWDRYHLSAADLMEHYRLSHDELQQRIEAAIRDFERSQIGTIHSFAAHLLRLYPLEAGVDPRFSPDEEFVFDEFFVREWREWLDGELGAHGVRHELWKRVLLGADLASLQAFAKALANDLIPLDMLKEQVVRGHIDATLRQWLQEKQRRTGELLAEYCDADKKRRQVEQLLAAAERLFGSVLGRGVAAVGALDTEHRTMLESKEAGSKPPAGWDEEAFDEAVGLVKTAKEILGTDHGFFRDLLEVLEPFAVRCRQRFLEAGYVRFDGLLARARDLLKAHSAVRKKLKRQFKAILVDEFQDTDPVQYEILLFLAEREDHSADVWQQVQLHPGKLFVVGDPKQSIFAFRRADIEAFQKVKEMVEAQDGLPLTLTRNFRSHAAILSVVNDVFVRLIQQRSGLQPRYDPLEADPDRKTGADTQGVELRLVAPSGNGGEPEALSAEEGVEAEAEAVARWLQEDVIGKGALVERDGTHRLVEPGDVAILFRTFTQSWEYLGALRRRGLPYVAEGEKHFYQRQEVIDLVNLLGCIQNPHDQVALLGTLRSPVGALTDREIMDLAALGPLAYRDAGPPGLDTHSKAAHLRCLYAVLESLHRDCPLKPLPDAVNLVFERLPVLELAAASSHGEQAAANLWKVRAMAEDLQADPGVTLAGFVTLLKARVTDPPDESESGLAEETSREAVRVMSIHKAKGLEFPIVILVGLQAGTKSQTDLIQVHQDWSTDALGLRLGDRWTLGGVYVAEKLDARVQAERRRLLYVGMTRAKERLVLSGAQTRRLPSGSFLSLLRQGIGEGKESGIVETFVSGEVRKLAGRKRKQKDTKPVRDRKGFEARWRARVDWWTHCCQRSLFLTPSMLEGPLHGPAGARPRLEGEGGLAAVVGSLVHKALESWNYRDEIEVMLEQFAQGIGHWIPEEFQGRSAEIIKDVRDVLKAFARSEACAELRGATILGREVPFLMPWPGPPPVLMEGRIDLLYEKDGGLWVADYKTDRIVEAEVAGRMDTYRPQAKAYTDAVRQALGRTPAGFKLIFLRLGKSVPVEL
jgi:ATP-dependent helicase/nuclease subunit A